MSFTLLPAVDVADGRAARLGTSDPMQVALDMQRDGARWMHLVDLDAAFERGTNRDLLTEVIGALDVPVELAGGIRNDDALEWALETDAARIVLAADALSDLAWCLRAVEQHGDRIAVSLDVRVERVDGEPLRGVVAPRGAAATSVEIDLWQVIESLDAAQCALYVVTDVTRDGAMTGPNVELCRAIAERCSAAVIASGGVSTIDDLFAVRDAGLDGCIVGSALWSGAFTLPQALGALHAS